VELGEVALVDPLELRVAVVPVVAAVVGLGLLPVVRNQVLGLLHHLKPTAPFSPVLHRLGDDDGALERRDVLALSGYFGSLWRVYNIMRRISPWCPLRITCGRPKARHGPASVPPTRPSNRPSPYNGN